MKAVKVNFAIVSVVSLILALMAVWLFVFALPAIGDSIDENGEEIETHQSDDDISDVEGYGMLIEGIVETMISGLGLIGIAFIIFMMFGSTVIMFVSALIARLIYKPPYKHLLAYRIFMVVSCVCMIVSAIYATVLIGYLLIFVILLIPAIICMVNTLSDRIKRV